MIQKKLQTFKGKRILVAVPGSPGISRLFSWNEKKGKYDTPTYGKIYCARRYCYKSGVKVRVFEYFETLEQARAWQIQGDINATTSVGTNVTTSASPIVADVITRWQNEAWPLLRENTTIQYEKCLKFLDPILHKQIESIRPIDIDALITEWKKNAKNMRSVRTSFAKEFETLTIVFRWYQKTYDDAALVMPFKERHNKQIILKASTKPSKKHMTDEEAYRFLQELKKDSPVFFALGFTQLKQILRISEAAAMKWSNFNQSERTYDLCEHAVWPRKDGKEAYVALGTKNIKPGEVYTLPLFQEIIQVLSTLMKYPGCDLIFHDEGKLLTYRQIQYRYDKAMKAAGLPYSGTHVLRHTGSTSFYNATGDLLALQHMGTWSNSRMPQHYAKVLSSRAKKAIRKLEAEQPRLKLVSNDPDDLDT